MGTNAVFLALASYLAGSIPFGLLIGKAVKGVDLRQFGSGNIGATNAGRVLGKKWGLICLALDALKGLLPVAFLPQVFLSADDPVFAHSTVIAGVATILGHMFPCWLGFRGGKGVATYLGTLAGVAWPAAVAFAALWLGCAFATRYSSASALVATAASPLVLLLLGLPAAAAVFAGLTVVLWWKHRENIARLRTGTEGRIGAKG